MVKERGVDGIEKIEMERMRRRGRVRSGAVSTFLISTFWTLYMFILMARSF
jgi:hypothetical protein